jgi:glycerophosphoryl diester phosphodiesterase
MRRLKVIFSLLVAVCTYAEQPPVWVIAHMTNSVEAVKWAAEAGANGVEADLHFDANGNPTVFRHSTKLTEVCDCTCSPLAPRMPVCEHLGSNKCFSEVGVSEWFAAVVAAEQIGLVFIDSKVDTTTSLSAGRKLISTLESELFGKGYRGMVVISSSKLDTFSYLYAAATAALASREEYRDRMYFTIDGEGSDTVAVLNKLTRPGLPSANIVYGTGESACSPSQFWDSILLGEVNRRAGVIGFNYVWTIDKSTTAAEYLDKGAGAIITNDPAEIVRLVKKSRFTLAAPGRRETFFPAATNKKVITAIPKCDCGHRYDGCTISAKAPRDWACQCVERRKCSGSVVVCKDGDSAACREPSVDKPSCEQGGGDCAGYQ